jgi:hypothetical protein
LDRGRKADNQPDGGIRDTLPRQRERKRGDEPKPTSLQSNMARRETEEGGSSTVRRMDPTA